MDRCPMPQPMLSTRTDASESGGAISPSQTPHVNLYLFIFAFVFSLYDAISTIVCMDALGYDHEANILLRWIMHNTGIVGFIGVKLGVTLLVLVSVYYIIANSVHYGEGGTKKFYGVYLGVIFSNVYAGASNTSVILRDSSFYLLGLNSMQMVLLLIFLPPLVVLLFDTR